MTKNGRLILEILRRARVSGRHLTAEEIYLQVKQETPGIVMATVYNNLNSLAAAGMVRRVRRSGGADYFDANTEEHDHLVCDRCGKVSDITLEDFASELEQRLGAEITGYELNIHYVCDACREKEL